MNAERVEVIFDETKAKRYQPRRVVKQALMVPVPEGVKTTIMADWGEPQIFIGPWYAIYDKGIVTYGSGVPEFDGTHGSTNERENGYFKNTPIDAYQYSGPPGSLKTILSDGTVETENNVDDGDWLGRWPHGEVGVFGVDKISRLYEIS